MSSMANELHCHVAVLRRLSLCRVLKMLVVLADPQHITVYIGGHMSVQLTSVCFTGPGREAGKKS